VAGTAAVLCGDGASWWPEEVRRGDDGTLPWLTRCGEDGGGRCRFVVVVRDGGAVAGEIGGGGCVEGGREIRVRVSCVRWRR